MSKSPQISEAEWEVMKVIWESPQALTAGDVVQRMEAGGSAWRPRTIKTLLARLVKKGAVSAEESPDAGRAFFYRPAVTREACVRQESRSFLSRVFDGDVAPAMCHFLETAKLSAAEIDQLRKLLDEGTKRGGGKGRAS